MNKYFIGIDLADDNDPDFSAAIISKYENGIIKIIDSKISKNSDKIREFVKKYEPEYFTFKYHFDQWKQIQKLIHILNMNNK
jgi:hypothetical protein